MIGTERGGVKDRPLTLSRLLSPLDPFEGVRIDRARLRDGVAHITSTWTRRDLFAWSNTIIGGLSRPRKMPGAAYSLPARLCRTGAQLAEMTGTVCSGCYALSGNYRRPNVQRALDRRFASLYHPLWPLAMACRIWMSTRREWRFRWHDSGDLQSVGHLDAICAVAAALPRTKHWLPTRELGIVSRYLRDMGQVPDNLTIRISAHKIDARPGRALGLPGSMVSRDLIPPTSAHTCPAPQQDGMCRTCSACWDRTTRLVSYDYH